MNSLLETGRNFRQSLHNTVAATPLSKDWIGWKHPLDWYLTMTQLVGGLVKPPVSPLKRDPLMYANTRLSVYFWRSRVVRSKDTLKLQLSKLQLISARRHSWAYI